MVVADGLLEDDQHLLLVDLVVLVQVRILDELPHLHQVRLSVFPQEAQGVLEEIEHLEVFQPAVRVDVVFQEDLVHCLPQALLWDVHFSIITTRGPNKNGNQIGHKERTREKALQGG
jgi:hypothetical protein